MAFKMKGWSAFQKDDKQTLANPNKDKNVLKIDDNEDKITLATKQKISDKEDKQVDSQSKYLTNADFDELRKKARYSGLSDLRISEILKKEEDKRSRKSKFKTTKNPTIADTIDAEK